MAHRRDELHQWIADTRRLQRRMGYGFAAAVVLCIAMLFWHRALGVLMLVSIGGTAVASYWITAAHIAAHRQKLDELDRAERQKVTPEGPQTGGHRRWSRRQAE